MRSRPGRPPAPIPTTGLGRKVALLRRWVGEAWGLEGVVEQREALAMVLGSTCASIKHWERSGRRPQPRLEDRIHALDAERRSNGPPPTRQAPWGWLSRKGVRSYLDAPLGARRAASAP